MNVSDCKTVYSAVSTGLGSLGKLYWEKIRPVLDEAKVEPPRGTFLLFTAHALHPQPISTTFIQQRLPYGDAGPWKALLKYYEGELGYLEEVQDGYVLTEDGQTVVRTFRATFFHVLAGLDVFPDSDLAEMVSLITKIGDTQAESSDPPGAEFIRVARNNRVSDAPLLAQLDHLGDELAAFRDECHIAAWRPLGVNGVTWDAFANVCGGHAATATELQTMLRFLGHSEAIFEEALHTAATKGWLVNNGGKFEVTDSGKALREDVEDQTDSYFFAPWVCLKEGELEQLKELATAFCSSVEARTASSV